MGVNLYVINIGDIKSNNIYGLWSRAPGGVMPFAGGSGVGAPHKLFSLSMSGRPS